MAGAKPSSLLSPHQRQLTKSEAGAPCYLLPIISHAIKSPVLTFPSNIWNKQHEANKWGIHQILAPNNNSEHYLIKLLLLHLPLPAPPSQYGRGAGQVARVLALVGRLVAPLRLHLHRSHLAVEGQRSHTQTVVVCFSVKVVEIFEGGEEVGELLVLLLTARMLVLSVVLLTILMHWLLHSVLRLDLEALLLEVLLLRGLWGLRRPPRMLLLLLLLLLFLLIHWRVPCGHWLSMILDALLWCVLRVGRSDHPVVGVQSLATHTRIQHLTILPHHHGRRLRAPHWTSHHWALPGDRRDSNSDSRRLPRLPARLWSLRDEALLLLILPFHGRVPVVFDGVVRPARDQLCNLCPLVSPLLVRIVDHPIFLVRPRRLLDVRVQVVVPPLSALLPNPPLQLLCNQSPTLRPVLPHQLYHLLVLLFGPRAFD